VPADSGRSERRSVNCSSTARTSTASPTSGRPGILILTSPWTALPLAGRFEVTGVCGAGALIDRRDSEVLGIATEAPAPG